MGMDLRVVPAEEWWEERGRDSSLDGERDLGLMVTDFLEIGGGGSGGGGVICGVAAIAILNFQILLTFSIRFRVEDSDAMEMETSKYMPYAVVYNVLLAISE
ncbi:hypothetical protein F2Q69_00007952 [Brassica cretica]|uniref:Uncharacterized protein n=1 Tax=Brassica cretica TaxID=69181 RepID=A0A8S9P5X7_BRACR|nr:hypothetical protein F2Q69_00007952 [Brassica cretica]